MKQLFSTYVALLLAFFSASCTGEIGSPGTIEPAPGAPDASAPLCEECVELGTSALPRLLRAQLIGVFSQTFAELVSQDALAAMPFQLLPGNASNGLFEANTTPPDRDLVDGYFDFAEAAAPLLADAAACVDRACAIDFLGASARGLYRRPWTTDEEATVLALMDGPDGVADWTVHDGLRLGLTALLMSPRFLYRIEVGGTDSADGLIALSARELAIRLSLWIWQEGPSEELLAAAEGGELEDSESVAGWVRRLLADPKSDEMVQSFFGRLYELQHFGEQGRYVEGTEAAAAYPGLALRIEDMRAETRAFVAELMRESGSFEELYTANYTFASDELAAYYGEPAGAPNAPLPRVEFDGSRLRSGILTHASVLGAHTTTEEYRGAHRGRFVLENLLCGNLPPVELDEIPTPPEGVSPRMKFEAMTDADSCQGCHRSINPAGFLFENFDGGGVFSETAEGFPVDASGGIPDSGRLAGTQDLGVALAQSQRAQRCMAQRWFEFALGRGPSTDEAQIVEAASETLRVSGDMRDVIVAIATSRSFRYRQLSSP